MKRSSPAADEEEMAVIVPPSPPAGVETMVVDPALEHRRSSPLTRKPCWRTSTTGPGVGAFIGTLLFLALLVRTEWNHIDVSDVSTVLYVIHTDQFYVLLIFNY
jgi:hypothetical protein